MDAIYNDPVGRLKVIDQNPINRIIGDSAIIQELKALIKVIAANDMSILITGDTGVGKSLVAQVIHDVSRVKGQSVRINCHNIPYGLLEDELFGHKAGAYTDAKNQRDGKIAAADGGTLVFEEIGDLPDEMQGKLLSILEDKEFSPVGSDEYVNIQIRIIATTNKDIREKIDRGKFRPDLYHRFDFHLSIPPLKEHLEDLEPLAGHIYNLFTAKYGQTFRQGTKDLSIARLKNMLIGNSYDWPGNVRELKKIIKQYVYLSGLAVSDKLVKSGFFSPEASIQKSSSEGAEKFGYETVEATGAGETKDLKAELGKFEKGMIASALKKTIRPNGRFYINKASELLGITRVTLRDKIKKYNIGKR